ncbi:MAG TPA: ABC transporter permease, partial [Halomonas sp.]|nr:ABC transporter permease [Halomonas sp.]
MNSQPRLVAAGYAGVFGLLVLLLLSSSLWLGDSPLHMQF